jgi:site-specific recombinase XerC
VTAFFVRHLAAERNVSPHTTAAYRDALKLLLRFARDLASRTDPSRRSSLRTSPRI